WPKNFSIGEENASIWRSYGIRQFILQNSREIAVFSEFRVLITGIVVSNSNPKRLWWGGTVIIIRSALHVNSTCLSQAYRGEPNKIS
ncbi:MAG: hypothetical protein MJ153_07660, partial [Clostridia bacterium]|nr:hypothetical protein [Clostridia bacterium]